MNSIKIWFPDFYTEYHRKPELGSQLVAELRKFGVDATNTIDNQCVLIFCGSFFKAQDVKKMRKNFPGMPVVHYNWDIYPFQIYGDPNDTTTQWWQEYLEMLKYKTYEILVPSRCTIDRTIEFTGRDATVVRSCAHPWEIDFTPHRGNYVLNVMRRYTEDPNVDLLKEVCESLKIPLVEPGCNMEWEEFKRAVANCRFLVSPFYEASTGGMTLLEGYYHGKDVLLSNSPRHGAVDYFGERGTYFQWDDKEDLKAKLVEIWNRPPVKDVEERKHWINTEHSEERFARELAERFWKVYERR